MSGEVSVRCAVCQARETLKQHERDEVGREEGRAKAIEQALPDFVHGWLLMLTNLALVDDTNLVEAYFEDLEHRLTDFAPSLAHKLPSSPERIRYAQTWGEAHDKLYEAGEELQSLDKDGEIPSWPIILTGKKDWELPIEDIYILTRVFCTEIVPQLATKGHRPKWQQRMVPRIPEIRDFMELHHNALHNENTDFASGIAVLENLVNEEALDLPCCPSSPSPDVALLDLWTLLDSLESGAIEPFEALLESLEPGASFLESPKFDLLLRSFRN